MFILSRRGFGMIRFTLPAAFVVWLASQSSVFAHKLHVEANLSGDRVRIDAYYEDDTPAQDARVTVSKDGVTVLEGKTDEHGTWTFPRPTIGSYLVKVESVGHAAKTEFAIGGMEVSSEPETRAANTRTPWGRLGLGIGLLIGFTLTWLWLRRHGHPHSHSEDSI